MLGRFLSLLSIPFRLRLAGPPTQPSLPGLVILAPNLNSVDLLSQLARLDEAGMACCLS
jgi:hypothetical protein